MTKVVRATYSATALFKVPKGIDLEDKTQVAYWGTKYGTLFIDFVDETRETMEISYEYEPELDCKYASDETIENAYDCGFTDSEEEDDDEDEDEEAPTAKSIVASIIANVVPT
jgi:hypothetical protein